MSNRCGAKSCELERLRERQLIMLNVVLLLNAVMVAVERTGRVAHGAPDPSPSV